MTQVSIQPGVGMLSLFPHMRYQPWYALGELVDNAIQSYVGNRDRLHDLELEGPDQRYVLRIAIETESHDGGRIVVRDNAAGIALHDFQRAFRVAEPPADATGLSQFGIGMKASAAWFAKEFRVRSSALGESLTRAVTFNIPEIVATKNDSLEVAEESASWDTHFTEVTLWNLNRIPKTRTVDKIQTYLGSIYREFLRNGDVVIEFNGTPISYEDPAVLRVPKWSMPGGEPKEWRRDLDIHLESGRRVRGWAALRETGATSQAGMALLYRNKVVQGGGGDAYKPETVFGRSNSFRSQRLFGELVMDDFAVTYTKDALVWFDEEEEFVERLRDLLDEEPLPLLRQAENYRVRKAPPPTADVVATVLGSTETVLGGRDLTGLVGPESDVEPDQPTPPGLTPRPVDLSEVAERELKVVVGPRTWQVGLRLVSDDAVEPWLAVRRKDSTEAVDVTLTVNQAHPFMRAFAEVPSQELEPVWRLAIAFGLGQELARESGGNVGYVVLKANALLRSPLAQQV